MFRIFFEWLQGRDRTSRSELRQYFAVEEAELDRAFLHLQEINTLNIHDGRENLDDYAMIQFVDRHVHPTYLRLAEAVYAPFIRIVAYFSRLDHGKGTTGLDVWNAVQELSRTALSEATRPYNHVIRNGIAHGGITYLQNEIRYQDKKGTQEEYLASDIVRLGDDMLDACNGLALALSLFLLAHQTHEYALPRQLLVDELREETRSPWWQIVGCIPSEILSGKKQLIIHVHVQTSDYRKVQFSTFRSGVLAERLAPGFDRYFFSLRSTVAAPGWAAFDGVKLRDLRVRGGATLRDYADTIEDKLIYYIPKIKPPLILTKIETMVMSLKLHWSIVMGDLRDRLGFPNINVRNARIHRNGWRVVLRGDVVIETPGKEVDQEAIRQFRRKIIGSVLRDARRMTPLYSIVRYLPLGFARVAVFRKDYRRRRLDCYGLGQDLIGTVQIKRIRRIQVPDIFGATIELLGGYRMAWNRAWIQQLDSVGEASTHDGSDLV